MLDKIRDSVIESVRLRASQGDCPTEPAHSVETLESVILDLAPAVDAKDDRHPGWTERGHAWLDAGAPAVGAVPAGEVACPTCGDTSPLEECATCGAYPTRKATLSDGEGRK